MGYSRKPRNQRRNPAMSTLLLRQVSIILLISTPSVLAQSPGGTANPEPPLATVDGQPITANDLMPFIASQLRPIREQEYQIKKNALDSLIGQRIMEAEAKKK